MARATILSSLGAGLYRVKLHFDNSRIETRLAHMATQIADYAAELAALEPDKTEKTTTLNTALAALNDYINATDPSVYVTDPTELNALNKATWTARGELDVILHDEKLLKLEKATLEKETELLNKLCPADFETNAWCVDYVTNKSGESEAIVCDYALWRDVGNNQIEHDTGVWLPAVVTPPQDNLIHPLASSEHATWFNLCMAPAAQRHAGRYRIATISNLNKTLDSCDLEFEGRYDVVRANGNVIDNAPMHPQFAEGQQDHYAGANIVYGACNGEAFENGDRVIVDLHSGVGHPTVIGFYSNPRQCAEEPNEPNPATLLGVFHLGAGDFPTDAIVTGGDSPTYVTTKTDNPNSSISIINEPAQSTDFIYVSPSNLIGTGMHNTLWSYTATESEIFTGSANDITRTTESAAEISVNVDLFEPLATIMGAARADVYSLSRQVDIIARTISVDVPYSRTYTYTVNYAHTENSKTYDFYHWSDPSLSYVRCVEQQIVYAVSGTTAGTGVVGTKTTTTITSINGVETSRTVSEASYTVNANMPQSIDWDDGYFDEVITVTTNNFNKNPRFSFT